MGMSDEMDKTYPDYRTLMIKGLKFCLDELDESPYQDIKSAAKSISEQTEDLIIKVEAKIEILGSHLLNRLEIETFHPLLQVSRRLKNTQEELRKVRFEMDRL